MTGIFLPPWAANKWGPGGCPAFPRMLQEFPDDQDHPSAREGQAALHYITETIRGRPVGEYATNKHPITQDMRDDGEQMLTDMRAVIQPGVEWCIEQELQMPQVHPTMNRGRIDFGAIDWNTRTVHSWEYKYGHTDVDVYENWQLVDYAVGLVNLFNVPLSDAPWTIDFRVYQPRSFHGSGPMKRWNVNGPKFYELVDRLAASAAEASQPGAPFRTGPQCDNCPARHACPALRAVGGRSIDMSKRGLPHVLEPLQAGIALREIRAARERLEDLETGLEAQIMADLRAGKTVPYWEAVPSQGREKWDVPADVVISTAKLMGHDLAKPVEALTPAQARKKGFDETVISAYASRQPGEIKLKPVDSKAVRKAFS